MDPGAKGWGEGFGATLDLLNEALNAALAEGGDPQVDGADGHLPGGGNFLLTDAVAQVELDGDVAIMGWIGQLDVEGGLSVEEDKPHAGGGDDRELRGEAPGPGLGEHEGQGVRHRVHGQNGGAGR